MATTEDFQVSLEAAEVYEAKFVSAIFAEWAPLLTDIARLASGQSVLDAACGTGIVARAAADRLAGTGRVVGVDINDGMLAVARRVRRTSTGGRVTSRAFPSGRVVRRGPVPDGADVPPDRNAAVREMSRVGRPSGIVAPAVPASLEDQPAYGPFVAMSARVAGPDAVSLLSTYWASGDPSELRTTVAAAGLEITEVRTHAGTARFPSPDEHGHLIAARVPSS